MSVTINAHPLPRSLIESSSFFEELLSREDEGSSLLEELLSREDESVTLDLCLHSPPAPVAGVYSIPMADRIPNMNAASLEGLRIVLSELPGDPNQTVLAEVPVGARIVPMLAASSYLAFKEPYASRLTNLLQLWVALHSIDVLELSQAFHFTALGLKAESFINERAMKDLGRFHGHLGESGVLTLDDPLNWQMLDGEALDRHLPFTTLVDATNILRGEIASPETASHLGLSHAVWMCLLEMCEDGAAVLAGGAVARLLRDIPTNDVDLFMWRQSPHFEPHFLDLLRTLEDEGYVLMRKSPSVMTAVAPDPGKLSVDLVSISADVTLHSLLLGFDMDFVRCAVRGVSDCVATTSGLVALANKSTGRCNRSGITTPRRLRAAIAKGLSLPFALSMEDEDDFKEKHFELPVAQMTKWEGYRGQVMKKLYGLEPLDSSWTSSDFTRLCATSTSDLLPVVEATHGYMTMSIASGLPCFQDPLYALRALESNELPAVRRFRSERNDPISALQATFELCLQGKLLRGFSLELEPGGTIKLNAERPKYPCALRVVFEDDMTDRIHKLQSYLMKGNGTNDMLLRCNAQTHFLFLPALQRCAKGGLKFGAGANVDVHVRPYYITLNRLGWLCTEIVIV